MGSCLPLVDSKWTRAHTVHWALVRGGPDLQLSSTTLTSILFVYAAASDAPAARTDTPTYSQEIWFRTDYIHTPEFIYHVQVFSWARLRGFPDERSLVWVLCYCPHYGSERSLCFWHHTLTEEVTGFIGCSGCCMPTIRKHANKNQSRKRSVCAICTLRNACASFPEFPDRVAMENKLKKR